MRGNASIRWALVAVGCTALSCLSLASAARAQVSSLGGVGAPSITPPPVVTGRPDQFAAPGRAEDAMIVGDWLLYPSAFAGIVFDSNPNQSPTGAHPSAGLQLTPSLLAERDDGISETTLYGTVNAPFYTNNGAGNSQGVGTENVPSARAGATEIYTPLPDLIFTTQGDYTLQKNLFSSLGVGNSVTTLNTTGVGLAPAANQQAYNQFSGAASVQKNFARTFVTAGGSAVDISYNNNSGGVAPSPNGITYTGTSRGGFWIAPDLYGYVEGLVDTRNYATSALSSSGYGMVGGVGSDQIGLFRGELYGGFQSETYRSTGMGTVNSPLLGATGYYYPLPELTLSVSAGEALGASLLAATPTSPAGTATQVISFLGAVSYSLDPRWTMTSRSGYVYTTYLGSARRDQGWGVEMTATYSMWRSFGLTFDYQHLSLDSSVPLQGFTRDAVTLGVTYKY